MLQQQINPSRTYVHAKDKHYFTRQFLHSFCPSLTSKQLQRFLGFTSDALENVLAISGKRDKTENFKSKNNSMF